METNTVTSEPSAPKVRKTKHKKRTMSAEQRKARSDAAKARWAAKNSGMNFNGIPITEDPLQPAGKPVEYRTPAPVPPSPAVLKLQEQVVELVAHRSAARQKLSEAHAAYLLAQGVFQAAEANVRATEQDAQYLLGLVAQLENRAPMAAPVTAPVLQMPSSLSGVTSEPATPPQLGTGQQQGRYAVGSADDLRREMRGMM